jgi:hypothetical protein
MFALRIQAHENIILIRRPQKKAAQLELPFRQIRWRLKRSEVFLVPDCQHDNGRTVVNGEMRKCYVKDRAHALKLVRDTTSSFLVCIRYHGEMLAADLQPVLGLIARRGRRRRDNE